MKIAKEQFDKIFDLICEIQEVCPEADTSSINMWLTMVAPEVEEQRWLDAVDRVRRDHPDWHESAIHQKAGDYMVWDDPDLVE